MYELETKCTTLRFGSLQPCRSHTLFSNSIIICSGWRRTQAAFLTLRAFGIAYNSSLSDFRFCKGCSSFSLPSLLSNCSWMYRSLHIWPCWDSKCTGLNCADQILTTYTIDVQQYMQVKCHSASFQPMRAVRAELDCMLYRLHWQYMLMDLHEFEEEVRAGCLLLCIDVALIIFLLFLYISTYNLLLLVYSLLHGEILCEHMRRHAWTISTPSMLCASDRLQGCRCRRLSIRRRSHHNGVWLLSASLSTFAKTTLTILSTCKRSNTMPP